MNDDYCWECGADWDDHHVDGGCPTDSAGLVAHLDTPAECMAFRHVLMHWAGQVEGKPGFEHWPLVVQKLAAAVDARERTLFEVEP